MIRSAAVAAGLLALLWFPGCAPPEGGIPPEIESAGAGGEHAACTNCGMDATASKSRFVIDFEDGTTVQACSGQCALSLRHRQTTPIHKVQVYGYDAGELIDGRGAIYVLGCDSVPEGSMGPPVFAFSTEDAAEAFVADHGGHSCDLHEVLGADSRAGSHGS